MGYVVSTFYRFVHLSNYYDIQPVLKEFCVQHSIKGTIILAEQGINATIAADKQSSLDEFFSFLNLDDRLKDIRYHKSFAMHNPFSKMKVKLRKELVCLGIEDFDNSVCGEYVSPQDWDDLISRSDVYTIDTRNTYEINFGKFKNAINPQTKCFRDFPEWAISWASNKVDQDPIIAMYCTGGIRCEKSTAFMKDLGFSKVYHLKGGILEYFKSTQNKNSLWEGDCFTFDDRIAVDNKLVPAHVKCVSCDVCVTPEEMKSITRGHVLCFNCKENVKI
ncbi:rhodanese-like domain protein [Ehrlichia chaffeensis str. Heartland]|uniref:tRNA uridine(34) hydroxylase n=1 Tax=Ehrlichia chaffeensis (strain ATCC CRL-10679 / Arkansas) TaxID=205920 RepID=TRHO_EHRCR|nr:rhodanese-like domain-containing protein [Ehrlichia chaffeensis]Q2GFU2.1 RecName: Full=tRNA uridine(34) hydroxylase; AltName: Full=tRNA hydroxylation protein O [Ehrlichia chaffeensis str. Arkansas]ABD44543.1 rhodanese domain protein [Ehrlichia chaffeensis str. Arkansas]AHX03938.1 rhodanese-like domain protein [Ehrlichia chaffeensis str. Heartland]AHX05331.1 rhodanese-like domain protein [Ehrlichia chaffeensis str. Jax]AHX06318.1 rhodanese-like domain protein [Ehrlichia chaffeensis str. Libe